jgi:hypothetical protein
MAFDGPRAALSSALSLKRSRVAGPIQSFSYRAEVRKGDANLYLDLKPKILIVVNVKNNCR